jgi:hypothetical protein
MKSKRSVWIRKYFFSNLDPRISTFDLLIRILESN